MGIQKQSLYATNVDLDPKVAHIPRFFLNVFFFFFFWTLQYMHYIYIYSYVLRNEITRQVIWMKNLFIPTVVFSVSFRNI